MHVTVRPIHFDDFDGFEFERLVFAYLARIRDWEEIQWYGQTGSEGGRDIRATKKEEYDTLKTYYFQCKNYRSLSYCHLEVEVDKLVTKKTIPDYYFVVCGGTISSESREKTIQYALSKGIKNTYIWSGVEFEEKLRTTTPSLIKRFCEGEKFPDQSEDLITLAESLEVISDKELLALFARCFDRPAFQTPFHQESSLPAFKQAIIDTIDALNEGDWRKRDGTLIQKIPSKYSLVEPENRKVIDFIVEKLIELKVSYEHFKESHDIKICSGAGYWHEISPKARRIMDEIRQELLNRYKSIYPEFSVYIVR